MSSLPQPTKAQDPPTETKEQDRPTEEQGLIGEDCEPGQAKEGTVLDVIERAIEKRMKSPDSVMKFKEMVDFVSTFEVVKDKNRKVCPIYIGECRDYYRKVQDGSVMGKSSDSSTSHGDGRSELLSSKSSTTSAPSRGHSGPLSSLALEDLTETIAIILPDDTSKAVTSSNRREGDTSYVSPRIVERCRLKDRKQKNVILDLRYHKNVNNRIHSYRVDGCSFEVRDGLATDIVIGRKLQGKLGKQFAHVEYSADADSSTGDLVSVDGELEIDSRMKRNRKPSSASGSSHGGSQKTASSKDVLDTVNRLITIVEKTSIPEDVKVHKGTHERRHQQSPAPSSGSGHSRRGDTGHASEPSTKHRDGRRRRS